MYRNFELRGKDQGVKIVGYAWDRERPDYVLCIVHAMKNLYPKDAVLSICSIEFDAFMLESVVPMLMGKTIVIPEKNQLENPKAIANLILGYAVGFMAITPSRLGAYMR